MIHVLRQCWGMLTNIFKDERGNEFLLSVLLGLFLNFLLFRIYSAFRLDMDFSPGRFINEFASGLGNDCYLMGIFILSLYVITRLFSLVRLNELYFKHVIYPLVGLAIFVTGFLTNIYFEYYNFSGTVLDSPLFLHYLFEPRQFSTSIRSEDFSYIAFIVLLGVWIAVTVFGFGIIKKTSFMAKKLHYVLMLIVFFGSFSRFYLDGHMPFSENFATYFVSNLFEEKVKLEDYFSERETIFDGCLRSKYEYTAKGNPFFKRVRKDSTQPIVDLREERPNIIFIFMEGFSAHFLDRNLNGKMRLTPETEKLIGKGLYFSNFYGNGVQTTRGIFASLCSIYPHFGEQISTHFSRIKLVCLPWILNGHGYQTLYIQGSDLYFDNMANSFRIMGFDDLEGYDELPGKYKKATTVGWGIRDDLLFDYAVELIENKSEKPLFLAIMTVTNHHPLEVPDRSFELYPPDCIENRFRNTIHYSDYALGRFIRILEKRGLLKNTIVVITADTSQPMKQHHENVMLISNAYEENFHIPLLLYAPDYIKQARQYDFVASQVDIVPTLLSLLNINEDENAFMGENMLAEDACHYAIMTQPYGKRNMVMRYKNLKYHYNLKDRKGVFYDLEKDPEELHPLRDIDDSRLKEAMHTFLLKTIRNSSYAIETNTVYPAGYHTYRK